MVFIIIFFYLVIGIGTSRGIVKIVRGNIKGRIFIIETTLFFLFVTAWIIFLIDFSFFGAPYYEPTNPYDNDYTPLSQSHFLSLAIYMLLSLISMYYIWVKNRNLPPLSLLLFVAFLIIGIVLSAIFIFQVSSREWDLVYMYDKPVRPMIYAPALQILISILLLIRLINTEANKALERRYKNKTLNYLNDKLRSGKNLPLWILVILLPIFLLITLILILLGQDPDSLVKVFTETTTWRLSQQAHPPFLDHQGHYLCTVAACGNPKIVKPKRMGNRHGNPIIVNRQLMIANAFEDLIQRKYPLLHGFIRKNYDKYGYPLSRNITKSFWSNVTYILMKPLEWSFLLIIYLFCLNPEEQINKQYN